MADERASRPLKILIVRADRLGDVILSTPVFEVLKRHYPHAQVTVLVREAVAPVMRGLASVDRVMIYDPQGKHHGFGGFFRLLKEIRGERFRIAVILQSQFKIAAAVFFAAIRYRVGPLSKVYSFVLYNRGARQHRSQVEMHETDYNLQLLRRLGIRVGTRNVPVKTSLSEIARMTARDWLEKKGWDSSQPLIAVHPGMGGSALNWPEHHYSELIKALLREGRQVVITGGPEEGALVTRVRDALGNLVSPMKDRVWCWAGPGIGPIDELAGLLSHVSLMVAPSTGPLHLAVALGKPVVTFYPPIRVQSAVRWGPYLRDETRASILVPETFCGEDFKCRGILCNYYPCMKGITVNQALEQTSWQLGRVQHEEAQEISKINAAKGLSDGSQSSSTNP